MGRLRALVCCLALPLVAGAAPGAESTDQKGEKVLSGMSIVGDHESPKSLVIVPWKSSDPGNRIGVSRMLDDGRRPVDRDVFLRELEYYQIGVESFAGPDAEAR